MIEVATNLDSATIINEDVAALDVTVHNTPPVQVQVIELLQLLVKYQIVKLSDRYLSNAPLFEGAEPNDDACAYTCHGNNSSVSISTARTESACYRVGRASPLKELEA
eukprot:15530-Heterococcus_DN1.PRE.1